MSEAVPELSDNPRLELDDSPWPSIVCPGAPHNDPLEASNRRLPQVHKNLKLVMLKVELMSPHCRRSAGSMRRQHRADDKTMSN